MSRVSIGKASYQINADTSGLTKGVEITRREINKANRILEQTKPAAQKVTEQMLLLEKAFKSGAIEVQQYEMAMARLRAQQTMAVGGSLDFRGALSMVTSGAAGANDQIAQLAHNLHLASSQARFLATAGLDRLLQGQVKLLHPTDIVGFQVFAGFTAALTAIQLFQKQLQQIQQAEDVRARMQVRREERLASLTRQRFDQELGFLSQINDEEQRQAQLSRMRSQIDEGHMELVGRHNKLLQERAEIEKKLDDMMKKAQREKVDVLEVAKLEARLNAIDAEQEGIARTNQELRNQRDILDDLSVTWQEPWWVEAVERQNQFLQDQTSLQEELARLQAEVAGIDRDRQRALEGLDDERRKELEDLYEAIDAEKERLRIQREREESYRRMVDDITQSIRAHERETRELESQAEAIKDRQDSSRQLERDLAAIERMGMEGFLDPDQVAEAIAEAVGKAMKDELRDNVALEMGSAAFVNFMQKQGRDQAQADAVQVSILQRQEQIQQRIANATEAQARALAALQLVD